MQILTFALDISEHCDMITKYIRGIKFEIITYAT